MHRNYVVEFLDGRCKFGVTGREPRTRVRELQRKCGVRAVRIWIGPETDRRAAFRIESDVARLLGYDAIEGTREWQIGRNGQFYGLTQTTGMFWHLRSGRGLDAYTPMVVSL